MLDNFGKKTQWQNLNAALQAVQGVSIDMVPHFLQNTHILPSYSVGYLAQHFLQTGFHTAAWTANCNRNNYR